MTRIEWTKGPILPASEAVLEGVCLKGTPMESKPVYDPETDCITGLGVLSSVIYTAVDEGIYDLYLEISRGASAFVCGSTPVTVCIAGGKRQIPSLKIRSCTPEQMGIGGKPSYMEEMGIFRIAEAVSLKAGDAIRIGGVPGFDYHMNDTYGTCMPAVGNLFLAPEGTTVREGYPADEPEEIGSVFEDRLSGLKIGWLGSSVTYGQAGGGYSMADALADRYGMECRKFAISATTLADRKTAFSVPTDGEGSLGSYVRRLQMLDPDEHFDLFIVQLSTNDASNNIPMGELSKGEDYDTSTVIGAMEYILSYVKKTFGCPALFYTGTRYDSDLYAQMVKVTAKICRKHHAGLIDLWNDAQLNAVSREDYAVYMQDPIHPTRAGYIRWWTPAFEKAIRAFLAHS